MSEAPELLLCPFCGSTATAYHRPDESGFSNTDWVCCDSDTCGCGTCLHDTSDAAIAAWSRRADLWQPIETAPKDGTSVLVFEDGVQWVAYFDYGIWMDANEERRIIPTHWQPLPSPPCLG